MDKLRWMPGEALNKSSVRAEPVEARTEEGAKSRTCMSRPSTSSGRTVLIQSFPGIQPDTDARFFVLLPTGATTGRVTVTTPFGTATSPIDFVVQ